MLSRSPVPARCLLGSGGLLNILPAGFLRMPLPALPALLLTLKELAETPRHLQTAGMSGPAAPKHPSQMIRIYIHGTHNIMQQHCGTQAKELPAALQRNGVSLSVCRVYLFQGYALCVSETSPESQGASFQHAPSPKELFTQVDGVQ